MTRWKVFCCSVSIVFMTACGVTVVESSIEINLKANENWEASFRFTIPNEEYILMSTVINETVSETVADFTEDGLKASWERLNIDNEGNVPIVMNVSGNGYDKLNESLFQENAISENGEAGTSIYRFYLSSAGGFLGEALDSSLTLKTGEVISTNGTKVSRNTVEWHNWNGELIAEFYEPTYIYLNPYLLIAIGVLLIFLSYLMKTGIFGRVWIPKKARSQSISNIRYCHNCGTQIGEDVVFCQNCGEKQK